MADERLLIIGVGNPDRGDDGAGHAVIAALRKRLDDRADADGIALIEHWGEATALVVTMDGAASVVIADAAMSGAEPGSYHCFEAADSALPSELTNMSSHGFGVAQAIELARALGTLPNHCRVYAIEAETFEAGGALSPGVAKAAKAVTDDIMSDLVPAAIREPSHA